jgi:hypothetical protein
VKNKIWGFDPDKQFIRKKLKKHFSEKQGF